MDFLIFDPIYLLTPLTTRRLLHFYPIRKFFTLQTPLATRLYYAHSLIIKFSSVEGGEGFSLNYSKFYF